MDMLIFLVLSIFAVGSALAVVVEKRPIYCALYFIVNLITLSLIYLTLQAEFVAVIQVLIYAGAVMVLFLFVLMMLAQHPEKAPEKIRLQRFLAVPLLIIFLVEAGYAVFHIKNVSGKPASPLPGAGFGGIAALGYVLFNKYLVPFEMTSLILLVAIIGAVYLGSSKSAGPEGK